MADTRLIRNVLRNDKVQYKELFRKRGVNYIDHYPTPHLYHPTAEDLADIETIKHVWKVGDRYSKLAYEFYGDPRYWWIIAWYNQLPTESHVSLGDVVYIPTPFDKILALIGG